MGHMSQSAQPPFLCVGIWKASSPDGTGSKTWKTEQRMLAAETEVFSSLSESPRMYISNYSLFHEFRVFVEHEAKLSITIFF